MMSTGYSERQYRNKFQVLLARLPAFSPAHKSPDGSANYYQEWPNVYQANQKRKQISPTVFDAVTDATDEPKVSSKLLVKV